jgi:hypothetical protein
MRAVARLSGAGLALVVLGCAAVLGGSGHWRQFAAPLGITFSGPADLRSESALGDGGLLAAYRCPRYYFSISWASYGASATGDRAWGQVPRREIETGEGYGEPWPCGAALHIKWLRPGATRPAPAGGHPPPRHDSHLTLLTDESGGDYRVLHFSAGCKTRRDRDELLKLFRSVRFDPW